MNGDFRTVRMRLRRFPEIADLEEYTVCGLARPSVDRKIVPVARLALAAERAARLFGASSSSIAACGAA